MILWFHVSAVVSVGGRSSVFLSFNHPPRNHFMLPPADLLNEDADFLPTLSKYCQMFLQRFSGPG